MSDMYWKPIACTLQLNFTGSQKKAQQQTVAGGSNSKSNGTAQLLQAGDGYTGVSVVRYRKEVLPALPTSAAEQSTEYGLFLRRLHTNAALQGLHVHAHSRPAARGPYAALQPMTNLNYKVTLASSPVITTTTFTTTTTSVVAAASMQDKDEAAGVHDEAATRYSSSSSMKSGTVLKIVSVVELDRPQPGQGDDAAEDDDNNSSTSKKAAAQKNHNKSRSHNNNAKKKQKQQTSAEDDDGGSSSDDIMADWGGKLVQFAHSAQLPRGAEVELSVSFAATVQSDAAGAVYAPQLPPAAATAATTTGTASSSSASAATRHASSAAARKNNNSNSSSNEHVASSSSSGGGGSEEQEGRATLLTHFEVALARAALVCPDCPQYRLRWQLKTLQLPEAYHTVYSNAACTDTKVMPHQRAVQYRFAPCGPLPAYAIAWSAFAGPPLQTGTSTSTTVGIPAARDMLALAATTPADRARQAKATKTERGTRQLPVSVFAMPGRGVAAETLDELRQLAVRAVTLLQDFFACPLPLLGGSALTLLLVPTMPYISGMEHHCCIALRDTLYSSSSGNGAVSGRRGMGNNSNSSGAGSARTSGRLSEAQISLVVHELAHHWVGNALGLPFAVKEGICQVLEQLLSDVLQGKPMRKLHKTSEEPRRAVAEVTKGKEFTGHVYQHALLAVQNVVCDCGFDVFRQRMRAIVARCLTEPMARLQPAPRCDDDIEEEGGEGEETGVQPRYSSCDEGMSYAMQHLALHDGERAKEDGRGQSHAGDTAADGPYLSTEAFLSMLHAISSSSSGQQG